MNPFSPHRAGGADCFLELFFFPRQGIQGFALGFRERSDVGVESRDGDAEICVVKLGDGFREDGDGIRHGAAEDAGMQILRCAGERNLIVVQPAQAVGDGGHSFGEHRGV